MLRGASTAFLGVSTELARRCSQDSKYVTPWSTEDSQAYRDSPRLSTTVSSQRVRATTSDYAPALSTAPLVFYRAGDAAPQPAYSLGSLTGSSGVDQVHAWLTWWLKFCQSPVVRCSGETLVDRAAGYGGRSAQSDVEDPRGDHVAGKDDEGGTSHGRIYSRQMACER